MQELIGSILDHVTELRALGPDNCSVSMPSPVSYELTGTMSRLTIELPAELHVRSEAKCARHGTRIADEITVLLRNWIIDG